MTVARPRSKVPVIRSRLRNFRGRIILRKLPLTSTTCKGVKMLGKFAASIHFEHWPGSSRPPTWEQLHMDGLHFYSSTKCTSIFQKNKIYCTSRFVCSKRKKNPKTQAMIL